MICVSLSSTVSVMETPRSNAPVSLSALFDQVLFSGSFSIPLFDILQGDKDQVLAFVDKNGLANMYMLPGVAYYISDTKNSSGTLDR